ncbi:MAG: acylphosphatase [Xanthomonadaceae bacterium]|nr:acylphosphatase [Xanthomonadaceae bacterium]MDE1958335.1 acylphosphatase [Xanthomonadaceae bacterium]MDE2178494.1 acylphosphatase [Xanthomonadaceae bacterium]MDE2245273.1 acylphosphatase [Xanthomonadaceae bacterium]
MEAARFLIRGHVQGVGFRAHARHEAQRLGLAGYAKNLFDGRVEVLAVGESAALDALERWLRIGPPAARVAEVRRSEADADGSDGFAIR